MKTLLAICLLLFTLPLAGQKWERLDERFVKFHRKGEFTAAAKMAVKEVNYSLRKLDSTDVRYMRSYYNLALSYYKLEQLDQAKIYLYRAYWLMAPNYTINAADFADVCDLYGRIETRYGYHDKAAEFLDYAREAKALLYGKNSHEYVGVLYSLAELAMARSDWEQMVILLQEALPIHEQHLKKDTDFATYANYLGLIHMNSGNYAKAISYFQKALGIYKIPGISRDILYANINNNLALANHHKGEYELAALHFEQADSLYMKLLDGYSENHMMLMNNLASLYYSWGRENETKSAFLRLEKYLRTYPDPKDINYIQALENSATYYAEAGDLRRAEKYYLRAIELRRSGISVDSLQLAYNIYFLADVYKKGGIPELGAETAVEAYRILRKKLSPTNPELLYLLDFLGKAYFDANQDQRSMYYYELAEKQLERVEGVENDQKLAIYKNLGVLCLRQGQLREALEKLEKAQELNPEEANTMINLGMVYYELGNWELAGEMYDSAKKSYGEKLGTESADYANALIHEIELMAGYGDYGERMLAGLKEVESICLSSGVDSTSRLYIDMISSFRDYYFGNEDYTKALAYSQKVVDLVALSYGRSSSFYGQNLLLLTEVYLKLDDRQNLQRIFEETVAVANTLDNEDRESLIYAIELAKATDYYLLGDFEKGLSSMEWVIERDKAQFLATQSILSARERTNFTTKLNKLTLYNYYLLQFPDDPQVISRALNNRLFAKGILMDSERRQRQALSQTEDTTLIHLYEKYRREKTGLTNLKSEFGVDQGLLDSAETRLDEMEVTISRMVGENMNADRRSYTWRDIQRKLGEDEAAVEILQFNYQPAIPSDTLHIGYWYAAFVITRETSEHPQCILVPLKELERSDYIDYKTFMETEYAGKLSDQLWRELNQAIAGKKTIYFSPDGGYHKFNLESFTDQDGHYAILNYKFKYVNSLLELLQAPMDYSNNQLALLVGDPSYRMSLGSAPEPIPGERTRSVSEFQTRMFPGTSLTDLPGTRTEVDSIGAMFFSSGWNCSILTGNNATEEAVSESSAPRVLHLATHGFFKGDAKEDYEALLAGRAGRSFTFDLDAGARSCLFFSGAQNTLYYAYDYQKGNGDGILTAGEIMEMNLDSTELVVLSACDTGLGDVLETGGIYGLRRAFHLAGARRVMISLWKVDDQATQLLMREFYSRWLSGMDMDDSLQEAKKYLIDHTEYSHPKYWAAFILSGI